ncbi:MAG: 4Fe-4S binding protein [Oscillospiraceae bacterium]|jgi:NAD-dependent dihydropyrimidine dehydrogenase PreA subunit|nr:4Fe-4S binding protein [Oscillospiraceae bacterium]
MKRQIIKIDEEKCNGCGLCAEACREGAIGVVDGKARLLRDDYCDGLGNCLPACPTGAITFEQREAAEYNEPEVKKRMAEKHQHPHPDAGRAGGGCPGSNAHVIERKAASAISQDAGGGELRQWPVQIKLVPMNAPYFDGANLLIAADCAAYARAGFHGEFMRGKITLIGCPKLDSVDYSEKLTEIIRQNNVKSVTVVRMQVPCCGGIEQAVITALKNSGKFIPWQTVTLSTQGEIIH